MRRIAAAVPPLENRSRLSARKAQARSIADPVKITDDDADGIISTERLKKERRYSLDSVLAARRKVVVTRLRPRGTAYIGMRGEV